MNKLRHAGIVVGDLGQGIEWYQQFNFYPLSFESVEINGKMVELCKMAHKDGSMLELLDGASAVNHVSFTVGKLLFDMLKENHDTKLFKKEGVCYIEDAWGNKIEIVEERGF